MRQVLTPQQEKFIECFVASGNATQSALAAGYSEKGAGRQGYCLKNRYQAEIDKRTRAEIKSLVPEALRQLKSLALQSESEQVRFQATRDILDRAGLKPTEKVETVNVEKSTDELRAELEQLRAAEMGEPEKEDIPTTLN
jgi:phage terminase small subunit